MIRQLGRRLWRRTVWSREGARGLTKLERDMLRYFLPFFDVAMAASGWFGFTFVVPALSDLWPHHVVDTICAVFASVAMVCFFAVLFPCLRTLELYAKDVLLLMLVGFALTIGWILAGWTDVPPGPSIDSRWYFLPFVVAAAGVPLLRIMWITRLPPLPLIPRKGRR